MLQRGRHTIALLALCAAAPVFAAGPIPPELQSLYVRAENGNAIAQYNLGLAYAHGRGVQTDPREAFVWLTLAAEQGSTSKELDSIVSRMSPAEQAESQRRLAEVRSTIAVAEPTAQGAPPPAPAAPAAAAPAPVEAPAPTAVPTQEAAAATAAPPPSPTPTPTIDPQVAELQAQVKEFPDPSSHHAL